VEDAHAAVSLGIDALGFIFVEKSPRNISIEQAVQIIDTLPPFIARVGVFVDSSLDVVKQTVDLCGLTQVQLHGSEDVSFCRELNEWNRSLTICKAFRIGSDSPVVNTLLYSKVIDCVLFDTYAKGIAGGTGTVFDWHLIDEVQIDRPLILAGGLQSDNVSAALEAVSPFAIDINSGVEDAPGLKNHLKLAALIDCVRSSDEKRSQSLP